MRLPGAAGQINNAEYVFDASGTIASGGTAQLVIPKAKSRSLLVFENISDTNMYLEIGAARASATLSSGTVASCAVTNAGFGYSVAPVIEFCGGAFDNANQITPTFTTPGLPDYTAPAGGSRRARAHCVMTGTAPNMTVSSIVIDDPGKGYLYPPYVFLRNSPNDPFGCATPSATSGLLILANGGSFNLNGTICTTDQIAVFCASSSKAYACKWTL